MTAGRAWPTLLVGAAATCCTLGCWFALHPVSLAPVSQRLPRMIVPAAALGEAELTMQPLDDYAGPEMGADLSDTDAASAQSASPARAARDGDTPPMAISPP